MAINRNSCVGAHNSAGSTTSAFVGFSLNNCCRGIPRPIDMRCQADNFLGADGNAEAAPFASFGINGDVI